jgi:hypothetical protein
LRKALHRSAQAALRVLYQAAAGLGIDQPVDLVPQLRGPKNLFGELQHRAGAADFLGSEYGIDGNGVISSVDMSSRSPTTSNGESN